MQTKTTSPFYLIDADSPLISANQLIIEATVTSPAKMLAMSVPPEVVDLNVVTGPQEIILALQYFPQLIEKMLGTIHFDFQVQSGMDVFLADADWKMKPKYLRWFRAMSELSILPFFIKDKDVRLYMLCGDFMIKNKLPVTKEEPGNGSVKYIIRGGAVMSISKRLADSCKQFLLYCHHSGFDPKDCIASMLADYSLPVHYADIYKQYQKEIRN